MKITVQSSKLVKPAYGGRVAPSTATNVVPLTVFDMVAFDAHISAISFFRPPAPASTALEAGLATALADYREWAGRVGVDADGNRAILLNDAGAQLVEATADVALDSLMPLEPTPDLASLLPSSDGAKELLLVQVTRFPCGCLAVGYTTHHSVGDGRATCNFLLAWGQATRGAAIDPVPVHDRLSFFVPRDPPRVEFEHRSIEFKPRDGKVDVGDAGPEDEVVVHRVHFNQELISELKSRASSSAGAPRAAYSTVQCVVAHLWRCITKARGLDGRSATKLHVAVNGCARMRHPRVPVGYTGNVVLWAQPATTAAELAARPLWHAVELVSREVARIDDGYFRSFIDFASSGAVEEEGLVPVTDASSETVLSPDVAVYSLLGFPFYGMDFGGGQSFFFMPGYMREEGVVFMVPSFSGDGSIDAYVSLFSRATDMFKSSCYSLAA